MNRFKETPFELLQIENRQRKLALQSSAGKYPLNRSSITPETKGMVCQSINDEDPFFKASCSRTAVNSCLKKSFYNRKWMNRSIDSRLTSEEFRRLKLRFDKVEKSGETENSPSKFRHVWESQCRRKYSAEETVKHEKEQTCQQSCSRGMLQNEGPEKAKMLNKRMRIDEIAEKRRSTLNFDLEILGNKKSIKNIRIKEMLDIRRTTIEHQDEKNQKEFNFSPQKLSPVKERRECCTKSKKMDFNFSHTCPNHENLSRKVYSPNYMDFTEGKIDQQAESKHESYHASALPQSNANKLRNSWNPGHFSIENKVQKSPQNLRTKLKTGALCNLVNDIQGWSVFPESIGNFSDQLLTL